MFCARLFLRMERARNGIQKRAAARYLIAFCEYESRYLVSSLIPIGPDAQKRTAMQHASVAFVSSFCLMFRCGFIFYRKFSLGGYLTNGLNLFSCSIVVAGPWPGYTTVLSGRVKSFVLMESMRSLKLEPGKSVLPMEDSKRVSPEKMMFWSGQYSEIPPGVWPGVCMTRSSMSAMFKVWLSERVWWGGLRFRFMPAIVERFFWGSVSRSASSWWM